MSNNRYVSRPWHLPEPTHPTNWATEAMVRTIKRRDPTRPAFWYLAYRHPHPPLVPLAAYLDLYRDQPLDEPRYGSWAADLEGLPLRLRAIRMREAYLATPAQIAAARRAFYALCTHIDHQLSVIVGTLREEALLDDTVICFTSDHGDMLGNHGLWAKQLFYEPSANVPLLLIGRGQCATERGDRSRRAGGGTAGRNADAAGAGRHCRSGCGRGTLRADRSAPRMALRRTR